MLPEEDQLKMYEQIGNMPVAWHLSAQGLLAAARILKRHRDTYDSSALTVAQLVPDEGLILFPELMLRGFALECLLKGLWVKAGNRLAERGRYIKVRDAADHDLVGLARAVRFRLGDKQRDVLKRVSLIMKDSGRYPIPKRWSDRKIQRLHGGGMGTPSYWKYPTDDDVLQDVMQRVQNKYES